jgi:hypothetical protein
MAERLENILSILGINSADLASPVLEKENRVEEIYDVNVEEKINEKENEEIISSPSTTFQSLISAISNSSYDSYISNREILL